VLRKRISLHYLLVLLVFALLLPLMGAAAHWHTMSRADQLDNLLREIAANHWHGLADDENMFDPPAMDEVFRERKLSAQCFAVSNYAVWRLREAGYQARNIALINTHPDTWNGTQDAHNVLEVWHPRYGQWVVVDLLFNRMYAQTVVDFAHERGTPIMLADDLLSNPDDFDAQLPEPETWEFGYPRLAQLVIIEQDGWWYGDASARAAADEYNLRQGTPFQYRDDFLAWAYG
jgi:hypothetical protein